MPAILAMRMRPGAPSPPSQRSLAPSMFLSTTPAKAYGATRRRSARRISSSAWRINTFGAFVAARCVLPAMKARGAGQIVFTGATASRRGGAKAVAFASAKAAQRSLAESLARAFGPAGVHVSLIVVDEVVNEPLMRARFAGKPDSFFVEPGDIADTAVMLTRQRPSAWTFELEARPFGERW